MTKEQMQAWNMFSRSTKIIRRVEVELENAAGLSLNDFRVLHALGTAERPRESNEKSGWEKPGPTVNELVAQVEAATFLERTAISRLVDRLVRRGLVVKNATGRIGDKIIKNVDGRHAYIYLTAEGAKTYKAATVTYLEAVGKHFARLVDDDDAKAMTATLERMGLSR